MKIVTGIDIVDVSEFRTHLNEGGDSFLSRLFLPIEYDRIEPVHLAGVFAAKEAVIKALSLKAENWKNILVKKKDDGRPYVELLDSSSDYVSCDLSISHTEAVAVAQFVALVP